MKKIPKTKRLNIRFSEESLEEAKKQNLDIAGICREALDNALRKVSKNRR